MLVAVLLFIIVLILFFLVKVSFPTLRFLEKLDAVDTFYGSVIYFIAFQFSGDEKVVITNEYPGQFILNLFLEKIGLDCL